MIKNRDKLTGDIIEIPEMTSFDVYKKVERAKRVFPKWRDIEIEETIRLFRNLSKVIKKRIPEIIEVVRMETGKPADEFINTEIFPILRTIDNCVEQGEKFLIPRDRKDHWLFKFKKKYVLYQPKGDGVATVISPWNFPFSLPFGDTLDALIAGMVVLLKPASLTPLSASLIPKLLDEAGFPKDVVQVLIGPGRVIGENLAWKADAIAFTGSTEIGKKLKEIADRRGIPISMELGGKDPLIVLADADIERAAAAAVWGSFMNAGQACNSIERVYVEEAVYDDFLKLVYQETRKLKPMKDFGPIIDDKGQLNIILSQIKDAVKKGAMVFYGNAIEIIKQASYLYPTILIDVNHDMEITKEETFGPVMPIMKVKDWQEALRLANDSKYALASAVFGKDDEKINYIVKNIEAGSVCVNDVIVNYSICSVPFGGPKDSGGGRRHGQEGILRFLEPKSVVVHKRGPKKEIHWYPYTWLKSIIFKILFKFL